LRLLKPHIYAKGAEFKGLKDPTGKIEREAAAALEAGARLEFIEDIVFSSSSLINRYIAAFSDECREYLELFRRLYSYDKILEELDKLRKLKVLVVGDAIIDEYVYCSPLGVSSKDPVLALLYQSRESFAGGAAAVANHVAQHVSKVIYCTIVGEDKEQEDFIRSKLAPNVEMRAIIRPETHTVRKTRILDGYSQQKQLEIYHMEKTPLPPEVSGMLGKLLADAIPETDMVISADFGNGCINPLAVDVLCSSKSFLAVNTQANAGNRGYHVIGRYARADFISLASPELQLEYRNYNLSLLAMLMDLRERMKAGIALVTEGKSGCSALDANNFQRAPSFTSKVVDRVGAGDALFSITALAAYAGLSLDLILFLGNIAGAMSVEVIGNAKAVSREGMLRYITTVLK
jgi:rfaE bifunctional protein kinase chain/domain